MPQKKRCKKKIKIPGIVTIDFYFYWGVLEQLGECCSLNHCSCWEILVALGKSCAWKGGMKKNNVICLPKQKEKHWKLCHAPGERPSEGSFLAVAISCAVFCLLLFLPQ